MPIKISVVIRILFVSNVHITHALLMRGMFMRNKKRFFVMAVTCELIDGVLR